MAADTLVHEPNAWDQLPDPETVTKPPEGDSSPDAAGDPNAKPCPVCLELVPKLPGQKRRLKYHDECNPKNTGQPAPDAGTGTRRSSSKAEREADEIIAMYQRGMIRAALMVSAIDRFDAFCIMVNLPQTCAALRGVLLRYDNFRKELLTAKEGGSIIGLAFTVLVMILPMAAHHGLIPHQRIAEALMKSPYVLFRLQQKMKEGEKNLTSLMEEQIRAMNEDTAARKKEGK